MRKTYGPWLGWGIGALLLIPEFRYIGNAWRYSPEDSGCWMFLGGALLLWGFLTFRRRDAVSPTMDWRAFGLLVPAFCAYLTFSVLTLHYGIYLMWLLTVFSLQWLLCGWRMGMIFFPGFALAVMGAVGMSYLRKMFFSGLGLASPSVWLVLALFLFGWGIGNGYRNRLLPRCADFFFGIWILSGVLSGIVLLDGSLQKGPPLNLRQSGPIPEMRVERRKATASDLTFFRHASVSRLAVREGNVVSGILMIRPESGIHEIHPAGHCLRGSGAKIFFDKLVPCRIAGREYRINELLVSIQHRKYLYWAWFSSREFSLGSFVIFRLTRGAGHHWFAYQISTPVPDGNIAAARQRLQRIVAGLRVPE